MQQALRLFPDVRIAHYDLGILDTQEGKYPEAIAELREAIRLDPTEADAHFRLAQVFRKQGKTDLAQAELKTVAEIQTRKQEHLFKQLSQESPPLSQ